MSRFFGQIGYVVTSEIRPGVWSEKLLAERVYIGDILQATRRWEASSNLNDNLNIGNKISVIADPFAYENFSAIRYIVWMGAKWKVTTVEVQQPRLILTIGGVYNEQPA